MTTCRITTIGVLVLVLSLAGLTVAAQGFAIRDARIFDSERSRSTRCAY